MKGFEIIVVIFGAICMVAVCGETKWIWNTNRRPQQPQSEKSKDCEPCNTNPNPNFGEVDFGRDETNDEKAGRDSIFPESPSRPSGSSENKDNSALPPGSIRIINNGRGRSEARLIPGAANFVSNALQGVSGGSGSTTGGGGLLTLGGSLIGSFLQNVPQLAGSALELLLGRPSKGNSDSGSSSSGSGSSNEASTLPASAPIFPILKPGGGGNSGKPAASGSSSGCKCIPLNSCFLPSRPGGSCDGGNIMCCSSSTGTRLINEGTETGTKDAKDTKSVVEVSVGDVRAGLLQNILKGSGSLVDDTLDLLLYRYYTEDDQQRLATRVLKSSR